MVCPEFKRRNFGNKSVPSSGIETYILRFVEIGLVPELSGAQFGMYTIQLISP